MAISVEVFPRMLQIEQKNIGKWREAIKVEMKIRKMKLIAGRLKLDTH